MFGCVLLRLHSSVNLPPFQFLPLHYIALTDSAYVQMRTRKSTKKQTCIYALATLC